MAFVNRSERSLRPRNIQTANDINPGTYTDGTRVICTGT